MADTRRLTALKALASAIDAHADKPTGTTVHRKEHRPFQKDKLPAAVVYGGDGTADDRAAARLDNTDQIFVELRITGDEETPPDDSIDPYFSWVWKAVMADPRLGGAAALVKIIGWERPPAVEKDRIYIGMAIEFSVLYQTRRDDPEQA